MPIPLTVNRYYALKGGINERVSPLSVPPTDLQACQNMDFYTDGGLRKRNGYTRRINATVNGANAITGLYELRLKNATSYFVITAGAKILYDNTGTYTDITGTVTITGGQDNKFQFATYNNVLIAVNGVDVPITWTGSGNAAALAGSPPTAFYVQVYNEHVFMARGSTNTSRLYISNIGDQTTWTAADFIDIGKDDGEQITGLAVLFNRLFIFKRRSIYQLVGTNVNDFRVDIVHPSIGCVSGWSIAVVEGALIFLSDRGFYKFTGIAPTLISDKIQNTMLNLNNSRTNFAHGVHYKKRYQYWCSVSNGSSATHNFILVYDYLNNAWTTFKGINANCFALERTGSSYDRLFHGDYASYVFRQDNGNVDDDIAQLAIAANFKTHPITMEMPEHFKRFRYVRPFFAQQGSYNVTVNYQTDFGSIGTSTNVLQSLVGNQSLWGTMTWGVGKWGGATIIRPRIDLLASGHTLELTFSNNSGSQPFTMEGFSVMARVKGVKRTGP